jgi:hypothetical protein
VILRIFSSLLLLGAGFYGPSAEAPNPETYRLVVAPDKRVSLSVSDGSLVRVIEDLGRRLGFEVIAQDVDDVRLSIEFTGLPPRQAIRAICQSVGYAEATDAASGETRRLVLTPAVSSLNRAAPRYEPLALRRDELPPDVEIMIPAPAEAEQPTEKPPPSEGDDSGS